jgi:hypothetical protein
MAPILFTAILWFSFVGYWLLAARRTKRTVATGQSPLVRRIARGLALGPALYYLPLSSVPFLGWRLLLWPIATEAGSKIPPT